MGNDAAGLAPDRLDSGPRNGSNDTTLSLPSFASPNPESQVERAFQGRAEDETSYTIPTTNLSSEEDKADPSDGNHSPPDFDPRKLHPSKVKIPPPTSVDRYRVKVIDTGLRRPNGDRLLHYLHPDLLAMATSMQQHADEEDQRLLFVTLRAAASAHAFQQHLHDSTSPPTAFGREVQRLLRPLPQGRRAELLLAIEQGKAGTNMHAHLLVSIDENIADIRTALRHPSGPFTRPTSVVVQDHYEGAPINPTAVAGYVAKEMVGGRCIRSTPKPFPKGTRRYWATRPTVQRSAGILVDMFRNNPDRVIRGNQPKRPKAVQA